MFKKLIITSAILAVSSSVAFASGVPYLGGSAGINANTSGSANARGIPFKLFAGYGATFAQNFYVAGEFFGTVGTANITNNGLKNSYGYGLDVLPGVMLSDHTMGFFRVGVARSRFVPGSGNSDTTVTGAQLGLGLQTNLMQNWDLRGDYVFTNYGSVGRNIGSPKSDEFDLGLIYKFD